MNCLACRDYVKTYCVGVEEEFGKISGTAGQASQLDKTQADPESPAALDFNKQYSERRVLFDFCGSSVVSALVFVRILYWYAMY